MHSRLRKGINHQDDNNYYNLVGKLIRPFFWGYLKPEDQSQRQFNFYFSQLNRRCVIGGQPNVDNVVLGGRTFDKPQCTITWLGTDFTSSVVKLKAETPIKTYVNNVEVQKGQEYILRDEDTLTFFTPFGKIRLPDGAEEHHRYVYHHKQLPSPRLEALYETDPESLGENSNIFKAYPKAANITVAIKTLDTDLLFEGPNHSRLYMSQRVTKEINLMSKLDHPGVCKLFEVFMSPEDRTIQLVMEYMPRDLFSYFSENDLGENAVRDIIFQLCAAIGYTHSHGIVHRDIKMENILVTDDYPPRIKLCDFGVANVYREGMPRMKTSVGTYTSAAPEMLDPTFYDGHTHLADSWSVGVITFTLLSGFLPYDEEQARDGNYFRIRWSELHNISPEGRDFLHKLLDVDPRSRLSIKDALSHRWLGHHITSPLRSGDIMRDEDIITSFGTGSSLPYPLTTPEKFSKQSTKVRASRKIESQKKSHSKRRIRRLESSQMDYKKASKKRSTLCQGRSPLYSPSSGLRNFVAFFSEAFIPQASFW